MSLIKIADSYTHVQKALHWAVVVMLALQYFVFDAMGRAFHTLMESGEATYTTTTTVHLILGVLVLVLTLWRLVLRATHGAPEAPEAEPELFRKLSKLAHLGIYGLLLLLPLLGLIAWFGAVGAAGAAHEILTNLLMALVIAHVGAVVVHQFYWKTNLLARMR